MSCRTSATNLCCLSSRLSCAACCGLYNVPDATRPALLARLSERSARFYLTPRTIQGLIGFEEQTRAREQLAACEPLIHVCEFCGFLDRERRLVGCLLHPLAPGNAGQDWRGLCHYGALACTSFFCPAFSGLSANERALLAATLDDWFLWGLVATDPDFLRLSLQLIERTLGQPLRAEQLDAHPAWRLALQQLLAWKDTWPPAAGRTGRTSRYHCLPQLSPATLAALTCDQLTDQLIDCLALSFALPASASSPRELVQQALQPFVPGPG